MNANRIQTKLPPRGKSRAAAKADEAARKSQEKADTLAADEEAELGPGGNVKARVGVKKK
jgi:hypothetical protein